MQASHERSAAIEKAARIMARGELDAALRLYLQIFDNDPHDWSVGNTLGDLYIRMGRVDEAVSHFMMLAEQLMSDGFAAKARWTAATYVSGWLAWPGGVCASRRTATRRQVAARRVGRTSLRTHHGRYHSLR